MKYFKIDRFKFFCFIITSLWMSVSAQNYDLYNDLADQSSDPSSYYAIVNSYEAAGNMTSNQVEAALRTAILST